MANSKIDTSKTEINNKKSMEGISIYIELTGYEKIKEQFNDIEQQIDRINQKAKHNHLRTNIGHRDNTDLKKYIKPKN